MKARLMTAFFGISLLLVVFLMFDTPAVNIAIAIILAVAAREAAMAVGCGQFRVAVLSGMAYAFLVPFVSTFLGVSAVCLLSLVYIILLFIEIIRNYPAFDIANAALLGVITLGVTLSLNCIVLIRDGAPNTAVGVYYAVIIFSSSWICDGGAYFIGSAFGKRRLAPVISPKKSVEGLYGGLAAAIVGNLLLSLLFQLLRNSGILWGQFSLLYHINYLYVALATPVLAMLGVLGDLSASVIKRRFGVKDFGAVFPGHGGMLDRFDSLVFLAPAVYFMMRYLPLL